MLKEHGPALLPEPPARNVGGAVFAGLFAVLALMLPALLAMKSRR